VGQPFSGVSNIIDLPGGAVGNVGAIIVSTESNVSADLNKRTVTELARKIFPIINTLKVEIAALQLTQSVLPNVEQAVRELKDSYLSLERQCDGCVLHRAKTDAALKLLNQAALAYDFSKIPPKVVTPLPVPGPPLMVGILSHEVVVNPAPHVSNALLSPSSGDLSLLDFDTFFQ